MLPLTGYADRLSVRPGETINFHVANDTGAKVDARIVRVISADPNPAGGGIRLEPVATVVKACVPAQSQFSRQGSYGVVLPTVPLQNLKSFTLLATIQLTLQAKKARKLFSLEGPLGGLILEVAAEGALQCSIEPGTKGLQRPRSTVHLEAPLGERQWHRVWASFDAGSQTLLVGAHLLKDGVVSGVADSASVRAATSAIFGEENVCIGENFNGRIERPMVFDRALPPDEISAAFAALIADVSKLPGLVAAWDFSRDMHTSRIVDVGPHALHGTLVNSPTRAVRGSNWTGREQCYRHAPEQYGAIHFHDDDVDDMQWPVTHAYTVPADLKSGAYALILKAGDAAENIPFFVVPPKGTQTAKLAVLVSTFTYTVYGNHARPEWTADPKWQAAWKQQTHAWQAYPHNPGDHREYGLSTYNYHTDGSGIALASWHRPMLNLRVGYVTYPYTEIRGSGLRHYPADSHLLAWLEAKGYAFDLVTDWELHHEGIELLQRYDCVMTGSHPEYHTSEMLDALEAYRDGGGRFMYLGGNGFYWKIALSPEKSGVIEIRRAEGGIRAWAAEPGEYYNQFDGEYGGLWRRNGRPPQKLVGVGFTAQGNFVGSHYRIAPEARRDPRTAWMFNGIGEDTIGGFGFSGHGAAGFELDRADKLLGTPDAAIVVARSENHPPDAPWVLVPEEQLTHITTIPGESHKQLIRADMTYFTTANGGAVFSTGSITFCGSLPHNNFDNSISTLLGNVLNKFLDVGASVRAT